jgi:hypothetical protein
VDTLSGTWWLPGEKDFSAPGTLEMGDDFRLMLFNRIGSKRLPTSHLDDRTIPVVLGRCLNRYVMLLDCQVRGWTEIHDKSGAHLVLWAAHVLLGDEHADFGQEISFNHVRLRLTHLNEWVNRSPFATSRADGLNTVSVKRIEPLVVELPDAKMTLRRWISTPYPFLNSVTWDSSEELHLELRERMSVDAILDAYVRPLRHLLTLAAGDRSQLTYMNVSLVQNGQAIHTGVAYDVVQRSIHRAADTVHANSFRFNLDDNPYNATVDFAGVVRDWFDIERENSFVCDLTFSLYEPQAGYLESKMFGAASAAEGLHRAMVASAAVRKAHKKLVAALAEDVPEIHRQWLKAKLRFAYEASFPERLHELIDYAGPSVESCIGNREEWIRRVVAARNGLAHPSEKSRRAPLELVRLMESTQMLVEIVLLRELRFSEEACVKIASQDWRWRHLAADMPRVLPELFK